MQLHSKFKTRICYSLALSMALSTSLSALEFGGMGNVSMGMGGAGVALKNSQWGLYYNPALLGASKKSRFGYSFGLGVQEKNLLSLARIDINNLQKLPSSLASAFGAKTKSAQGASTHSSGLSGGVMMLGAASAAASKTTSVNIDGYFGDMLKNLVNNGSSSGGGGSSSGSGSGGNGITDDDLKKYLQNVVSSAGVNGSNSNDISSQNSLEDAAKKFQEIAKNPGNQEKLFGKIQEDMLKASAAAGGNPIFDSILKNMDASSVGNLAGLLSEAGKANGGNLDLDKVLGALGGIKLSGVDASLDQAIKDISLIQDSLRNNNFVITSQNGIVLQITKKPNSGFAMGIFGSLFANGSASFDESHNQIIVQNGSNYISVGVGNDGITVNKSDNTNFDNHSIFSNKAQHKIDVSGLMITEVPIGYGYSVEVGAGEISVGMALKYIFSAGYRIHKSGGFDAFSNIKTPTDPVFTHNFGIDAGILYSLGGFSLGLVGKNLNNPGLYLDEHTKYYLNPQVRSGMAYQWGILNLAMDVDLLPNDTLSYTLPKSQMIGGGLMLDLKVLDIRMGAMYDMRGYTASGIILTGGINILGFLDIAVQSSTRLTEVNGFSVPDYLSLKIGGGFSW